MTDEVETPENDEEYRKELLARAALMGLKVHPNAKAETIQARIRQHLEDGGDDEQVAQDASAPVAPAPVSTKKELHPSRRLIRCIVTCNDPQKADQSGDTIYISNSSIGDLRFYFPFNKPWHVPQAVLDTLKEAKLFLHSSRNNGKEVITREVPRYNIEILPPLSEKEREKIHNKQAAALATED